MTENHDELERFLHRWAKAIVTNDVSRMAPFVSDDWLLIDLPGLVTAEQFHSAVHSGALRHDSMTHEVLHVRQLAPDVALLVARGRNTGAFNGAPITADEWTTDILVRDDHGWRCILTQLTPVA